ncbi:MAG: hypothetical protein Q3996_00420 [Candidatus Saccharibacteria bacterium]|nr:hypothetical protein [Candidatus Saccharibacteria bacterium]
MSFKKIIVALGLSLILISGFILKQDVAQATSNSSGSAHANSSDSKAKPTNKPINKPAVEKNTPAKQDKNDEKPDSQDNGDDNEDGGGEGVSNAINHAKAGVKQAGGSSDINVSSAVAKVVNFLLFLIGIISVIMIIYGGIQYSLSAGDSSKVTSAKNTILYAIVGLIVAMLAFAIVNFVTGAIK